MVAVGVREGRDAIRVRRSGPLASLAIKTRKSNTNHALLRIAQIITLKPLESACATEEEDCIWASALVLLADHAALPNSKFSPRGREGKGGVRARRNDKCSFIHLGVFVAIENETNERTRHAHFPGFYQFGGGGRRQHFISFLILQKNRPYFKIACKEEGGGEERRGGCNSISL